MSAILPAGAVLAASGEAAKSGPLGLVVILVLCIACYFLFKSMSKHLRRVREDFPAEQAPEPPSPDQLPRPDAVPHPAPKRRSGGSAGSSGA